MAIKSSTSTPDYIGLVRFLIQPFLESPESLSIDCETSPTRNRVWIRIAFDNADKGKVFGRGGRNIQAIRTCVSAAAQLVGQSVYLDIYGSNSDRDGLSLDEDTAERLPPPRARDRQINVNNSGSNRPNFIKPRTRQA
ncbi:hypothetical protein NIES4101_57560 [Calothrix sp. NIES-4101]|nr:hypothetical protein NIES4101_57560 [Calothrix sp. NIES-4101]